MWNLAKYALKSCLPFPIFLSLSSPYTPLPQRCIHQMIVGIPPPFDNSSLTWSLPQKGEFSSPCVSTDNCLMTVCHMNCSCVPFSCLCVFLWICYRIPAYDGRRKKGTHLKPSNYVCLCYVRILKKEEVGVLSVGIHATTTASQVFHL